MVNLTFAKTALRETTNFINRNSNQILTVASVVGLGLTTGAAIKVTPKALNHIDNAERKKRAKLTKLETFQACWKDYVPVAILVTATGFCIVKCNDINQKKQAALASAYILSDTAFKEFKEQVVDSIGEKKCKEIEHEVVQKHVDQNPPREPSVVISTGHGDSLCYDRPSGRYFKSNIEKLRRIENDANRELRDSIWMNLNDLYFLMGLPSITVGEFLGWDINYNGYIDFNFDSTLVEDPFNPGVRIPCITIDYKLNPRTNDVYY